MRKPFRAYMIIVLLLAGLLFGGRTALQQAEKFGCLPPDGIKPANGWMDACASDRIGSGYGHTAIWYDIEPTVRAAVMRAQVLFFGDSRIMAAVSRSSTPDWFASRNIPFYLLAFGFGEQSGWAGMLLQKFHPHPAVMIFDADPYFTGGYSPPVEAIRADPGGELKTAQSSEAFMQSAGRYCRYLPWVCGRTFATYRSYQDGHLFMDRPDRFWFSAIRPQNNPITKPPPPDKSHYEDYAKNAQAVLDEVSINPRCVVFTISPNSDNDDSLARFLAQRLGGQVIAPQIDGLTTVDRWHLTPASAEIWMSAFMKQLQPVLAECIPEKTTSAR